MFWGTIKSEVYIVGYYVMSREGDKNRSFLVYFNDYNGDHWMLGILPPNIESSEAYYNRTLQYLANTYIAAYNTHTFEPESMLVVETVNGTVDMEVGPVKFVKPSEFIVPFDRKPHPDAYDEIDWVEYGNVKSPQPPTSESPSTPATPSVTDQVNYLHDKISYIESFLAQH